MNENVEKHAFSQFQKEARAISGSIMIYTKM